jgi:hypothetical protein
MGKQALNWLLINLREHAIERRARWRLAGAAHRKGEMHEAGKILAAAHRAAAEAYERVFGELDMQREVTVCAACLTAACWHGEFMCETAQTADITTKTVAELLALDREHPSNFSFDKVSKVCGLGNVPARRPARAKAVAR